MSEVITIYDVRGIQNYIFRTNALKEIVGASKIVEKLIIEEFNNAIKSYIDNGELNKDEIILNCENQNKFHFDENRNIKIEVLYYGGGNLVVLFRTEDLCKKISTLMSKNIMQNAYGLSLVYAYVTKTRNYNEDWSALKMRLSEIKAVTPLNKPAGILPIVQYDALTSKPLSKIYNNKKVTFEAYQKLKKYEEVQNENSIYIKEFDKMRTSNEEGLIAVVHIDGNSMGMNIRNIMKEASSYAEAVKRMRKISNNIHKAFEVEAIKDVEEKILQICRKHDIKVTQNQIPFRPLIQAGDDITFVCNERIALDIAEEYIKSIRKKYMYNEDYKFSACAGIAIIHSHYPFYKGYAIAEECCKSAKERAKNEGKIGDKIGNFIDFEYCYSISTTDLNEVRANNYTSIEGNYLLKRPYGIYEENENINNIQKEFDINIFKENLKMLKGISRGVAKTFRDNYYETETSIKTSLLRHSIKNNIKYKPEFTNINGTKYAEYFDALEMLDIFGVKEENHE